MLDVAGRAGWRERLLGLMEGALWQARQAVSVTFVPKLPAGTWQDEQLLRQQWCARGQGSGVERALLAGQACHPSHATPRPAAAMLKMRLQRGMGYAP